MSKFSPETDQHQKRRCSFKKNKGKVISQFKCIKMPSKDMFCAYTHFPFETKKKERKLELVQMFFFS